MNVPKIVTNIRNSNRKGNVKPNTEKEKQRIWNDELKKEQLTVKRSNYAKTCKCKQCLIIFDYLRQGRKEDGYNAGT